MVWKLDIYDPVRMVLMDDIVQKLLDGNEECDFQMRVEAMSTISQLRDVVRWLAPPGSEGQNALKKRLPELQFNLIYWDEYSRAEYRKIEERKKREANAIEWIGA